MRDPDFRCDWCVTRSSIAYQSGATWLVLEHTRSCRWLRRIARSTPLTEIGPPGGEPGRPEGDHVMIKINIPPDGYAPLRLTFGRWHNKRIMHSDPHDGRTEKWIKKLAHIGHYEDLFAYGCDHPSTWNRSDLQRCTIHYPGSGTIGLDVDRSDEYLAPARWPRSSVPGTRPATGAISTGTR